MIGFPEYIIRLGRSRGQYVVESIDRPVNKVLDVGCSFGGVLGSLTDKATELWGIDMDEAALAQARRQYPDIKFVHQTAINLPFESNAFDVVILSEVIEHVGEDNKQIVIDEICRVLKEGGLFIFTAPYEGLFSWADHLDFKRRFPVIYQAYMRVSNYTPDTPIEVGHKHLTLDEIKYLFGDRFQIIDLSFCGLFMPFINWIIVVGDRLKLLPKPLYNALIHLQGWEGGVQYPRRLAFNIRLRAYKKSRDEALYKK